MKDDDQKWIAPLAILATIAAGVGIWVIVYLLVKGVG
jgi:hypothetical protein